MAEVKGVQVTLSKKNAERILFLRKFKHRLPDLNQRLEAALVSVASSMEKRAFIGPESWVDAKPCPKCASGVLYKKQRRGAPGAKPFYGCSRYPECRHKEPYFKGK